MNFAKLGIRNAFRNGIRSFSVIIILSLAIGLSLMMLIAHQAVGQKIKEVEDSVGNTITVTPAGFNSFSSANNALTTDELSKVNSLPHVANLNETLTDRLTTIGSSQPSFGRSSSSSNNQTSLKSPVTVNFDRNRSGSGNGFHVFISGGGSAPSNFSPPITIIGTNNPNKLNQADGSIAKLSSGQFLDGTKDSSDAMVSTSMASKNKLKVSSIFTAYGKALTVVGIFNTGTQGGNDAVVVSLPTEQRLSGQSGVVTSAIATVDSADNLSSTTKSIKSTLGSDADVVSSQQQADSATQPLKSVQTISLVSVIGATIAGAVIVLLVMVMIVRERRREIGILKAIGASNLRVILQFISEAVTLTVIAAAIGILIGIVGGSPVTNTLVTNSSSSTTVSQNITGGAARPGSGGNGSTSFRRPGGNFVNRRAGNVRNTISDIHTNIGWNILAWGLGAALLIAIVGSAFVGWSIARVRPSEVLRSE